MLNYLEKIIHTFSMRWYVVVFLIFYILIGLSTFGWRRLLVYTGLGYVIALICEAVSIRWGFPFGLYHYSQSVINAELSLFGVPVWDSLSFVFLTFFPYQLSLLIFSPIVKNKKLDFQTADTWKIRHSVKTVITAVFLMMMIDTVVDPITLQGKKWFLGYLYYYPNGGSHFGVPISNYLGWGFTGFCIISVFVIIDSKILKKIKSFNMPKPSLYAKALYGLIMYYGIFFFNITITFAVGMYELGVSSVITYTLPTVLIISMFFKKSNYAGKEDIENHLKDFPESKILK